MSSDMNRRDLRIGAAAAGVALVVTRSTHVDEKLRGEAASIPICGARS